MSERRKQPRSHLLHYLRMFDRFSGTFQGNLVDITPDGIKMLREQPIASGTRLAIRMDLPEEFLEGRTLEFDAVCAWCAVDADPDLYAAGFHLENLPPSGMHLLQRLIDEFRDSE